MPTPFGVGDSGGCMFPDLSRIGDGSWSMRTQRDNRANNENARQRDEYSDMMESYHQLQDIHI
jgi:hypothetical protein